MRRAIVMGLAISVVIGGMVGGILASGAFSQDQAGQTQQAIATRAALETSVQATGDANTPAPKQPITVVTSCPDQNALHPKTGIFALQPHHGSPDKMLGPETNAANTIGSDGLGYRIVAGAAKDAPSRGALLVQAMETDPCAVAAGLAPIYQAQVYQTPFDGGSVTLVGIDGDSVVFQAVDGTIGRLDYLTGTFTSADGAPLPTATIPAGTAVPAGGLTPARGQ